MHVFDLKGKLSLRRLTSLEISGAQQVLSTGRWNRPLVIEACLNVPGTRSSFRLAVTAIGSKDSGTGAQYGIESLPGGGRPMIPAIQGPDRVWPPPPVAAPALPPVSRRVLRLPGPALFFRARAVLLRLLLSRTVLLSALTAEWRLPGYGVIEAAAGQVVTGRPR